MQLDIRRIRNLAFIAMLAVVAVAAEKKLFAASCGSWSGGYDFIHLYSCGEYVYDNDAIPDMRSIANGIVINYSYGDGVYCDPYWWARLGS